jgi:hypothetical protein
MVCGGIMQVSELIAKLKKMPQDMVVTIIETTCHNCDFITSIDINSVEIGENCWGNKEVQIS